MAMNPNSAEGRMVAARLEDERERITRRIADVVGDERADGPIATGADAAAATAEAEAHQELRAELDTQLAEVEAALQRLASGTYGIDEVSGEPIDPERLDAFPTARTNI
jgi:DnaK suppressor protein